MSIEILIRTILSKDISKENAIKAIRGIIKASRNQRTFGHNATRLCTAFDWASTPEGFWFWDLIDNAKTCKNHPTYVPEDYSYVEAYFSNLEWNWDDYEEFEYEDF